MQENTILEALAIAEGVQEMPEVVDVQSLTFIDQYLTYWVAEKVLSMATEDDDNDDDTAFRTSMSAAVVAAYLLGLESGVAIGETEMSPLNQEIIAAILQKGSVTLSLTIE